MTSSGISETRRPPGSGAGPAPDRLVPGSEGILGVVTEAWMRVQDRPRFRAAASVQFDDYARAADCVRALAQSGLHPTNCRLLDPLETVFSQVGDGRTALLVLGFESADHPLDAWMDRALQLVRDFGGRYDAQAVGSADGGVRSALAAWRDIKMAANEAVIRHGGTITHHHAVGRDHRSGYEREVSPLHRQMLAAAKQAVDPQGILNPGVLIDPAGRDVGLTGALAGTG